MVNAIGVDNSDIMIVEGILTRRASVRVSRAVSWLPVTIIYLHIIHKSLLPCISVLNIIFRVQEFLILLLYHGRSGRGMWIFIIRPTQVGVMSSQNVSFLC